jgi:Proteobacterial transcriptional regulator-like domain
MSAHIWPLSLDSYDYLVSQPKSAWAWEFLRRNARYRADARQSALLGTIVQSRARNGFCITRLSRRQCEAEAWGLYSFRRSNANITPSASNLVTGGRR